MWKTFTNCKNVPYVFFSHTFDVESMNSLRLVYLPKRTSFGMEAMEVRGSIVLLDHNFHLHRPYKTTHGRAQLHRSFNPRTKRERPCLVKEAKTYPYIDSVIGLGLRFAVYGTPERLLGPKFDPKILAPTIRGHGFVSTDTRNLADGHVNRFVKKR